MKKPENWIVEHVTKTLAGEGEKWIVGLVLFAIGSVLFVLAVWLWGWLSEVVEVYRWHYWIVALFCPTVAFAAGAGVIVLLHRLMIRERVKAQQAQEEDQLDYLDYRDDLFFDLRWRWNYDGNGAIDPYSIKPVCPTCDRFLQYHDGYGYVTFSCNECGQSIKQQGKPELWNSVILEIAHRVDKGLYPRPSRAPSTPNN